MALAERAFLVFGKLLDFVDLVNFLFVSLAELLVMDEMAALAVELHSGLFDRLPAQFESLLDSYENSKVKIALETQQWKYLLSLLICSTLYCPKHNS